MRARTCDINSLMRALTADRRAERLRQGTSRGCVLQTIQQLEARALRRADAVDELDRLLYAAKGQRRAEALRDDGTFLWPALKRLFLPNRSAAKVQKLEQQHARARSALRIAVDALHQAHCEQLRTAPWSGSLLAPSEAGLRDANEDYRPWNRVQMSGKRALEALDRIHNPQLDGIDMAIRVFDGYPVMARINEKIEATNKAGEAIQGFLRALHALKQEHARSGSAFEAPGLSKIANRLAEAGSYFSAAAAQLYIGRAERMITALVLSARQASGVGLGEVEDAQDRLEEVNHQIALAAWSKIPARLRPESR